MAPANAGWWRFTAPFLLGNFQLLQNFKTLFEALQGTNFLFLRFLGVEGDLI